MATVVWGHRGLVDELLHGIVGIPRMGTGDRPLAGT